MDGILLFRRNGSRGAVYLMVVKEGPQYLMKKLTREERCGINFSCVVFVNGCYIVGRLPLAQTQT